MLTVHEVGNNSLQGTNMKNRVSLLLMLAIGATAALVLGCSSVSTEQEADSSSAPSAPQAAAIESPPQAETVEVGYKVGLRAPEFGMSLLDGSSVTSAGLVEEGKPVFLYFHATY